MTRLENPKIFENYSQELLQTFHESREILDGDNFGLLFTVKKRNPL